METVLGVHDGHNAAAAVLRRGEVVAAVQEERLTRTKNTGGVPRQAIAEVLSIGGTAHREIERLALNGLYMTYDHWDRDGLLASYEGSRGWRAQIRQRLKDTAIDRVYQRRRAAVRAECFVQLGFAEQQLASVEHHTAHAAAAYYGCGWSGKVLVLTCDGSGDRLSATVSIGDGGHLTRIAAMHENDSIGLLYAMVTHYLGMMPLEHEYKVMGLAPYVGGGAKAAEQARRFAALFEFDPRDPLVWRRRGGVLPMYGAYGLVRKLLYRQRFDLIAAGLQQFVEDMLTEWVRRCVRETGIRRVACSGGVFMNVKANKEIFALPEVDELFVFPSCGDETNSVGAAYFLYAQACLREGRLVDIPPLGPIYWGRDLDDAEVERALRSRGSRRVFHHRHVTDIERVAAEQIARGDVVARAKGRMEFGARALGNRSILARSDDMRAVRIINEMIKNRDFWMPFAPSILAERAEEYYVKPKPMAAPYMIIAFDARSEAQSKYPAAQHPYDATARPQEVQESWNPDYYRLLKYYEEITGEGILLNTSFNLHGYPIVYTPADALDVFERSGLRYLALGNWWVWKE
jgi:carbamoyltransferase